MSEIKLKPCPFCGSSAGIQKDITGKKAYHVVCNDRKCECLMVAGIPIWAESREEAAKAWNRRSNETNII